ncbi:MAG: M3 family oligoendopeptidase [Anaerolineae bacterium]|nr:M3 family oligoendopeptidase [Anaerolineae bacterium]
MQEYHFEQTCWTRAGILPAAEGPTFEHFLAELEEQVARFEASRETLSPDIGTEAFLELLQLSASIYTKVRLLGFYGSLWFSEDTQSQAALSFQGRAEQIGTDVQNRMLFFSLWWKGLDDENAQRLAAASGDDVYYLESLRRFKPYTLSEAEEKVINLKDVNGPNALITLYSMITNRFTYKLEVDGEVKEMTRGELATFARHPTPELRAASYQELLRTYQEQTNVLAQIYTHLVRDWRTENVTMRGFPSPISVRNLTNDIPDPVVETLLAVCRRNMPLFHRYFGWKAGRLGMERLRRYDVYAPIRAAKKTFPFAQAADMVLDNFQQFSPTLADHARRVFAEQHLDSEIRAGKRSGAFCASAIPGLTPWVLTNYTGQTDDVLTLAHEMGHAVHAMMAEDHSIFTFHSTLPLAETASVFSEMMLADRWLQAEADPGVRRDLLVAILDGAYATIARQAYFVLYEVEAHRRAVAGATADELCAVYLDNLREQFGDAVDLSDDFRWEWLAIPHIYHTPFYCYAYSFGHLMVLALYQQYKEEGPSFVPRFLKVLTYGGSASPTHITREAGFDIASDDFWQGGFDALYAMLAELETLEELQ